MKKTLLILCCLYVVFTLQAVDKGLSNFYFSHITGEYGLSQSNVKAIIQDSYGFMWFGTKNGLNRFDGTSIVQMNCDDYVAGTGNHNISALFRQYFPACLSHTAFDHSPPIRQVSIACNLNAPGEIGYLIWTLR